MPRPDGNFPEYDPNQEGRIPGVTDGGAGAKQPFSCPITPACLDVFSRMLEQTFRGFQLAARRPSHINQPFQAKVIEDYAPPDVVFFGVPVPATFNPCSDTMGGVTTIPVIRTGDLFGTVSVDVLDITNPVNAVVGFDYTAFAQTIVFGPGVGLVSFMVTILAPPDSKCLASGLGFFTAQLSNIIGNAVIGSPDTVSVSFGNT